ncbi:MAG: exopolyphosphatase / guanosine-5-triphosphate,3-diphosphate pyrophosphatase [Sphingomonadales bacterium]|jgi:exopolyphosphatase/guanosine-5'-triphosphate,3'-diphosphate pyrophosphatase|nr:exopolyphosphatase / guanosine-5-triphosphate,3-diphosphate pyrophosphatase [Sphingomonadales bacterium]
MFAEQPVAIIDIGSNSVRLVVYSAAKRIPSVIFNEKVLAGLGRDVGEIGEAAQQRALAALDRFRLLIKQMGVVRVQTVATAAVREASNGAAFLARVRRLGFAPRILSGEEEGRRAGQGVLSAIPDADGIVGDLGGGSLELVQVGKGKVGASASLPLGVLRLDALLDKGESSFRKKVAKAVAGAGFAGAAAGRPFYLVGGSWRTLARLEMALIEHPLPITHEYEMATGRPRELKAELARIDKADVRDIPSVSLSRFPTLPNANLLLEALAGALEPKRLIVSSFGIREGLLYDELPEPVRALDPLIEAAREAGAGLGRFEQHGDMLDQWIAPAFDDGPKMARLRLAACLLSDIGWAAHPDFRAERGVDMALHGNWVAIDAPGRVMLAQALFCNFGGGRELPYPQIAALCSPERLRRAANWGLAMRLGQRLSGGIAACLKRSRLSREGDALRLEVGRRDAALLGETVERRLKTLAAELGLRPEMAAG